jgi:DNA-binding MarR family transcriptional regulator
MDDRVDRLLEQWADERPELDCGGLDVVARVQDAAKLLRRSDNEALKALELKMSEYDVLSALRRQGAPYQLPATELAQESLLSSGAMTNRIDGLEARGLVERETDPNDRRGVLVRLTSAGRRLVDDAIEARLHVAEEQLSRLSQRDRKALSAGLRKIIQAAS